MLLKQWQSHKGILTVPQNGPRHTIASWFALSKADSFLTHHKKEGLKKEKRMFYKENFVRLSSTFSHAATLRFALTLVRKPPLGHRPKCILKPWGRPNAATEEPNPIVMEHRRSPKGHRTPVLFQNCPRSCRLPRRVPKCIFVRKPEKLIRSNMHWQFQSNYKNCCKTHFAGQDLTLNAYQF